MHISSHFLRSGRDFTVVGLYWSPSYRSYKIPIETPFSWGALNARRVGKKRDFPPKNGMKEEVMDNRWIRVVSSDLQWP